LSVQKSKAKPSLQRASVLAPPIATSDPTDSANNNTRAPAKTTLADWTAEGEDNDVNGFYAGEKRQRGGRKKRKKNKKESHIPQNWDDIYDPSRPNNYEDYKHSDERILEIREWKDKLYAHRIASRRDSDSDDSGDRFKPQMNSTSPSLLERFSLT
jgi:splicing factor 45